MANRRPVRDSTAPSSPRCLRVAALLTGLVLAGAGPLSPAAAQPTDLMLDRIIADLGSPDFSVREEASAVLDGRADLDLADLEAILRTRELTPEQRRRVQAVAKARFAATPRGAIGVQFGGNLTRSRIIIGLTYPGFQSQEVLKPGDMIVAVAGVTLPRDGSVARAMVRSLVFSHDPGDTIDMVIRRGAERMEVSLTLGSFQSLVQRSGGVGLDELDLTRAWAVRSERLRAPVGADDEPITCDLPPGEWPQTGEFLQLRYKMANMRSRGGDTGTVALAAGGEPRSAPDLTSPMYQLGARRIIGHPLEELTRQPVIFDHQRELDILAATKSRLELDLERRRAQLNLRELAPDQRAVAEEMLKQFEDALDLLELERAAVEAEAAELGALESKTAADAEEIFIEER